MSTTTAIEYEHRPLTAQEKTVVEEETGFVPCAQRVVGETTWYLTYLTPEEYAKAFPDAS